MRNTHNLFQLLFIIILQRSSYPHFTVEETVSEIPNKFFNVSKLNYDPRSIHSQITHAWVSHTQDLGNIFGNISDPWHFWYQVPVLWKTIFPWTRSGGWDGLGMIQAHYTYCALYFYYYCISSTSDHQALDSGHWGPTPPDLCLDVAHSPRLVAPSCRLVSLTLAWYLFYLFLSHISDPLGLLFPFFKDSWLDWTHLDNVSF